jgi:hypothetical protein
VEEYVAKPVRHHADGPKILIVRKLARHFGQTQLTLDWPCDDDGHPIQPAAVCLRRAGYVVTAVRASNGLDACLELVLRLPGPSELTVLPYPDPKGVLW